MASPADRFFEALRKTEGAGNKLKLFGSALLADPFLAVAVVVIIGLILFFGRIYVWPQLNPFKIQWISDLWDWATSPSPPTPQERYPYAKVIYPTYR